MLASCHALWQLVCCVAISCKSLAEAQPPQEHRRLLANSYCCEHKFGYVRIHDTVWRRQCLWQLVSSLQPFFLLLSCKTARHTVQAWLYSVFLSCIPASLQQHISCLPLPLLSFSSLLSAMTTMLPLGHHLPFIQHFSFHSLFEKTLACSRCCSTVSDPCCKTKTPIMLQARLPV